MNPALTWKDVLDEKIFGCVWDKAKATLNAGYKYFVHNGRVYEVNDERGWTDTGITAKEIK